MKEFVSLEHPTASICNLDCIYCYIPKNKILKKIHKKWKFGSEYISYLKKVYKQDKLQNFTFWGGEPTLGLKNVLTWIDELLDYFYNLTNFSISTNLIYIDDLKFLLIKLAQRATKQNKKFTFSIQVSIDGDKEIFEYNRGVNKFDIVINNLFDLVRFISTHPDIANNKNFIINIHNKPTAVMSTYKYLLKNDNLKKLLSFFINVSNDLNKLFADNISGSIIATPTLALPGKYTTEDGKLYYQYNLKLKELSEQNYKEHFWKINKQLINFNQYYVRLIELLKKSGYINRYDGTSAIACSAGRDQITIDGDQTTHMCHQSLWYTYPEYIQELYKQDDWIKWQRIFNVNPNTFFRLTKNITYKKDDIYNQSRVQYLLTNYHKNFILKLNNFITLIDILAKNNQISKIYNDKNWQILLASFIFITGDCWIMNYYTTGSLYTKPISEFRIYGNGFFEFLVKEFNNYYKNINLKEKK